LGATGNSLLKDDLPVKVDGGILNQPQGLIRKVYEKRKV